MPPKGTSIDSEFDLLCHLELEPPPKEKGDDDEAEAEGASVIVPKWKQVVPEISNYWLQMTPNSSDYIKSVVFCFQEGLECI